MSKRWWVHFHGAVYSINFDFAKPISEKEFRKHLRAWLNLPRIPYKTEIYKGEKP